MYGFRRRSSNARKVLIAALGITAIAYVGCAGEDDETSVSPVVPVDAAPDTNPGTPPTTHDENDDVPDVDASDGSADPSDKDGSLDASIDVVEPIIPDEPPGPDGQRGR